MWKCGVKASTTIPLLIASQCFGEKKVSFQKKKGIMSHSNIITNFRLNVHDLKNKTNYSNNEGILEMNSPKKGQPKSYFVKYTLWPQSNVSKKRRFISHC